MLDFSSEAGNSTLKKHTNSVPSMNCNQDPSTLREGNEGSKTNSPAPTTRLSKRKKNKQCFSRKSKEDENILGEQLLKEFADFQSSRSDKVDGCEESTNLQSDRSKVPEKGNSQPVELPTEKGKTGCQEGDGSPGNVLSEECTPTIHTRQEMNVVRLEDTNKDQTALLPVRSEDTHAGDEDHSDARQVEINVETHNDAEPEVEPTLNSESLAASIYHRDSKLEEMNEEIQFNSENPVFDLNSAATPLVRSNTIPGLVTSMSSSEENTYTITELAPAAPMDLTSLVSSLCSVDGSGIGFSNLPQTSTVPWSPQTPSSSSEVQTAHVWGPAGVTPHGIVQEDICSQTKEKNQPQKLTFYLPPVSSQKEANEQLVTLVNGGELLF